ncbi:MAG: 16S rRNA (guanine(527)-N(7))-methyltransferase RsmG [Clostridia bacterium]|nr:16S rRNA (guanine(527)-N(7))-methyltransferase RsmG [Clostridia bacterium]
MNVTITDKQLEKLNIFKDLLLLWNEKFNLTAIKDEKEMFIKHFEDSIKGAFLFPENASVIEIGSGGGFPSIPLMIVRSDLTFTLVESVGKKCEFLKEVIKTLKLNATVINARAEDLGKNVNYREKFTVSTARAVAKLNTLCEYTMPLVKVGGLFIAYKGYESGEEVLAKNAIKTLGGKLKTQHDYELSENYGKRTIFVIEKIEKTPDKYPRGNGKERSKPL